MKTATNELTHLAATVTRLCVHEKQRRMSYGQDWYVHIGWETRRLHSEYSFEGLRRGGDPKHPYFIVQYTLDGWGVYEENGVAQKVLPGMAFLTSVPTDHHYYLPPESSFWTFFHITLRHPYIVSRLQEKMKTAGEVVAIKPDSRLMTRLISIIESCAGENAPDPFTAEGELFDFLMEYERFSHQRTYSATAREQWLEETRQFVLRELHRPIDISELAAARGMSRSYFSHCFKTNTGLAPAQWVKQIRLEEATRRLVHTDQKLETIARETGLANANHLCKVFRRRFHLSPGEFRRQMR